MLVTEPSDGISLFLQPRSSVLVSAWIRQFPALRYTGLFASTVIDVKLRQPAKAVSPMLVTLDEIVTDVKLLQSRKDWIPMLVTPSGIVTDVMPVQAWKALFPMLEIDDGIVTDVKPLQP